MKVKVTLKFRGREMAHTEFGFQVVRKFLRDIAPYGHPDFEPKLIGRGINVMISPLPRNKRGKALDQTAGAESPAATPPRTEYQQPPVAAPNPRPNRPAPEQPNRSGFANNPFAQLEINR